MKKIFIWVMVLPMLSACDKSIQVNDNNLREVTISKNNTTGNMVTRPLKVDFYSTPNFSLPPVQCLPAQIFVGGGGWINGNCSHIGLVDASNSPFSILSCAPGPEPGQVTTVLSGTITAANGDAFYYSGSTVTDFSTSAFTGTVYINGGTGRFSNAYGNTLFNGTANFATGVLTWTGEGTITY